MKINELIILLGDAEEAHGNIEVKIDGFDVTSAEIVPALNEFEPYFEIIGL